MNPRNEQGFLLVSLLLILALMAVTLVTLNLYTGTQVQVTALHRAAVQADFDRQAVLQDSLWQVYSNSCYRTAPAGEPVIFNGVAYTRKILNSTQAGYTDAITLTVTAPGGTTALKRSYRYMSSAVTGVVQPQPGTVPTLNMPERLCLDAAGNLFIADTKNERIVKRDPAGILTRVAGSGLPGYSGDGGLAVNAMLNGPSGVAVDPAGNLYIADTKNHRIRRVDTSGTITTVAGTGVGGYSGDGVLATAANINEPFSVFFHNASNSFYIADSKNFRIRQVDSSGTIFTVAGSGVKGHSGDGGPATAAQLDTPYGVHVRPNRIILIADTQNHAIRRVTPSGIINTVAGSSLDVKGSSGDGGPATSALLNEPYDVTSDAVGNLYIADTKNFRIRRVSSATGIIQTIVGSIYGYVDNVPALSAQMYEPTGIVIFPAGGPDFFVSDTKSNTIRKITLKLVPGL